MKEPPEPSELTGSTNLIAHHRLSNTYIKLLSKKKNELGAFLHQLTDVNVGNDEIDSKLKSLLETRITIKEILPMTATQSVGFRLMAGALPPQYRLFNQTVYKKHKKHKKKQRSHIHDPHSFGDGSGPSEVVDPALVERKKKEKKKEKKKDKKDKKEKKRKVHGQPASGNDEWSNLL